jgi:hypothetical protein
LCVRARGLPRRRAGESPGAFFDLPAL